jgi:dihydrolipoamide dehydrogenase
VIGAQVLGNYSSEFIVTVGIFIERGFSAEEVMKIVFPHPTVGEIIREAAYRGCDL